MNARVLRIACAVMLGVVLTAVVSIVPALIWRPAKLVEASYVLSRRIVARVEVGHQRVEESKRKWWARYENDWAGEATVAYGWPLPAVRGVAILGSGVPIARWEGVYWGGRKPTSRAEFNEGPLFATDMLWLGASVDIVAFSGLASLSIIGVGWARKRSRRRRGACERCGYDLVGTVGGVCPECGTVVERGAAG